jgi:hypothetical protein
MATILGVILGAIIIAGALAWSFRHPSPRRASNNYRHSFDGISIAWADHHFDSSGSPSASGSFGV